MCVQLGLQQQYVLSSSSAGSYAAWVDSDDPDAGIVVSTYWVYNITNAPAVLRNGSRPKAMLNWNSYTAGALNTVC